MATVYVSQTATNGYAVGNDANTYAQAQSKSTPLLTVEGALAVSGLSDGDTITINDGTYTHASAWFAPTTDNLTINSENQHLAILRSAASQVRTFHIGHASVNAITFGNVVLDGYNDTDGIVSQGVQGSSITFSGTKLLNPTAQFVSLSRDINITFSNNFICEATSLSQHAINLGSSSALGATVGALTLSDGQITVTAFTDGKSVVRNFSSDVTGKTFSMENVTITAGGTTSALTGVSLRGCSSVNIKDNTIALTTTGASADPVGIEVKNSSLDNCDACHISGNTVNITRNASAGGQSITVGDNDDTTPAQGAGTITKPYIGGNTLSGANHGVLCGWVTGANVFNNKLTDNVLGVVLKNTTSCRAAGNVIVDCTGSGALRCKGDTNSVFGNNLVYYSTGASVSSGIALYADASAATDTTGAAYNNNCIYADAAISDWVSIAPSSTSDFDGNNYYVDTSGSVSANPYNYQGTGYANLAAWNGAATVGANLAETETDPALSGYQVTTAALLGIGYKWWGGDSRPTGYGGEPFPDWDIDVGAVQGTDSTNHPFHPSNLL